MQNHAESSSAEHPAEDSEGERIVEKPADYGWSLTMYKDAARASKALTNGEFRALDGLLSWADWSSDSDDEKSKLNRQSFGNTAGAGGNCFPNRKKLAAAIGRSPRTTDGFLAELERKKWIRRIPFMLLKDGSRTTDLVQFRLPAGAEAEYLKPKGPRIGESKGIDGPIQWDKRRGCLPYRKGHRFWSGRDEP